MTRDWFAQKCPRCGHRAGLHSGPDAIACRPGTCHGGPTDGPKGSPDCAALGTWCGWHPDLAPADEQLAMRMVP